MKDGTGRTMQEQPQTSPCLIDDLKPSGFHLRLALVAGGGPFCDGYILGIIGIALPIMVKDFHLSGNMTGLLGASSLFGVLLGGLGGGIISDRLGRKRLYTLNLLMFAICSCAQYFAGSLYALLFWRLLIGMAIGADYPIATAYVTEFMPRVWRGPVLSGLITFWWVGYIISFIAGYLLSLYFPDNWRIILGSSLVPSALLILFRIGMPESPRWLMQAGRADEARAVVREHLGAHVLIDEPKPTGTARLSLRHLFQNRYRGALAFVCAFWILQSAPSFAIHTLQAPILEQLKMGNSLLASCIVTSFTLLGSVPVSLGLINVMGRRKLLIGSFAWGAIALFFVGLYPHPANWFIIIAFIIYSAVEAAGSGLQFVYPNELFPTEIRGTAVGFASSASRLGAAVGTVLLPMGTIQFGVHAMMLVAAMLLTLGAAISWRWAPETATLNLSEASQSLTS